MIEIYLIIFVISLMIILKMAPSNVKMPDDTYNDIKKVSSMPEEDFKRQIQEWMETQQPKLQSQLRKDLIENFTKTSLGRQITSTMQNRQGIVLSPLTLVLNTLVSEFLHSQDYHFTLSVFATEVVFPHTLPDFSKENFSFSEKELDEIFEAMGILNIDSIASHIGNSYYETTTHKTKENRSLLYAMIKTLIDHLKEIKEMKLNKQIQAPTSSMLMTPPKKPPRQNLNQSSSGDSEVPINLNNLKVLNKTIEKLSKSVKNMARHYMHMESSRLSNKSHHSSKLEMDREEKHYYNLMRHIESISEKLDKCVVNFESLERKLSSGEDLNKMRYREWLEMMSNTKNGRKYIDKFQRSIQRYWEAEKEKLRNYYENKLNVEKKAMKLKYREELREQIEQKLGTHKTVTDINKDTIKEILENKMQTIESRDQHLSKKLDKLEGIVVEYKDDEQKKKDEIRKMAQKLTETLKTVEKTVQQVPESIVCLEKRYSTETVENEVENIIKSAKSRIKKLEQEGELLEKSFLNYLQRQKDKKQNIETDRIKIWQDYQLERRALIQSQSTMPRTSTPFDIPTSISSDKGLAYDEMAAELNQVKGEGARVSVVNPFKTFDTATYLQKAHERRLLEGPKIERLEAYRRLDREVETIKRKVFMEHGFKNGVSNMYLNPRGGSIFGASRYLDEKQTEKEEKEIQTEEKIDPPALKEVKWHGILKQSETRPTRVTMPEPVKTSTIPTISVQNVEEPVKTVPVIDKNTLKPPSSDVNPSSDRSSPLKSDLDLGEVTLDIELSKTKSSNSSENEKPIPDIGTERTKSPQEKGAKDANQKETWRDELSRGNGTNNEEKEKKINEKEEKVDETLYKSLVVSAGPSNSRSMDREDPEMSKIDSPLETTVKDMTFKIFENSEEKFETKIERMSRKADELHAELNKGLRDLLSPEPKPSTSREPIPSSTTSDSHIEVFGEEKRSSSDSSEPFKISTGKVSSSETSEEFWK